MVALPLARASGQGDGPRELLGMSVLAISALLPSDLAAALASEALASGAVHVKELTAQDWQQFDACAKLLTFRLVAAVSSQS